MTNGMSVQIKDIVTFIIGVLVGWQIRRVLHMDNYDDIVNSLAKAEDMSKIFNENTTQQSES